MTAMQELVSLLREKIDNRLISVNDLAEAAGCSRQHVWNVLHGKQNPSLPMAESLAAAAGYKLTIARNRKKMVG